MAETQLNVFTNIDTILQNPTWYHALTLTERLTSLRTAIRDVRARKEGNTELAEHRLQRWKRQSPFDKESYFSDRLTMDAMSEDDLCYLLGEPIDAVRDRMTSPPDWLIILARAFENFDSAAEFTLPMLEADSILYSFMDTIKPLIKYGLDCLNAGIKIIAQREENPPFDFTTITRLLYSNLPGVLLPQLVKTLVLELNIVRLQGTLQGNTAEERFHSFVQQLNQRQEMLLLLARYPVLARLLVVSINHWVDYSLEFLNHLCTDWNEICATFASEYDPGMLTEVKCGIGDAHCRGKSVIHLKFSSGFELIYKPKSLAIDIHFQALLHWLNARGKHPPFRAIKLIDKGTYGWSEFVPTRGCTTVDEIARFYERQGGYLALLYALHATDVHFENLIASGEYPILIDLETLFHPLFWEYGKLSNEDIGMDALELSVLRPGMLPARVWLNASTEGVDVSGLGGKGGQTMPRPVPTWEEVGTDQMRLTFQRAMLQERQNRPTLNGTFVDIRNYLDNFIEGFTTVYRLLMEHREELLTEILPDFAYDEIRLVMRATRVYSRLLQEAMHPTLLRDALARDRFFDHLWNIVEHHPNAHISRIIPAECSDLRSADIPIFTSNPSSLHIYTGQKQCIANFLIEPSIETVRRHIQQLNEQDLTHQLWLIQVSFAASQMASEEARWKPSYLAPSQAKASRERLLRASCAVGDRLAALAHSSERDVFWLNLILAGERQWILKPTSLDLYNGTTGIIFFLAYLGALTGESRYTTLARSAFLTLRKQIKTFKQHQPAAGAFDGWGGLLYLYTHLGVLWNDPTLFREAEELISLFSSGIENDEHMDILRGAAGCILCLLNHYHVAPSPCVLAAAIRCGDRLLACAQPMPRGIGWITPLSQERPLTGFSHGAAGITLSLLALAAASGEERFQQASFAAMEYERGVFLPELQNWPDFRDLAHKGDLSSHQANRREDSPFPVAVAWCHGAPGIALGRLASLPYIDGIAIREEIDLALETTLSQGFGMNHSLCHGDLGNLEVLLTASRVLNDPQYHVHVECLAAMILDSIETYGWSTGVPLGTEIPGLMTGIAGIGYELLRLVDPDNVPSVLQLAFPGVARSV